MKELSFQTLQELSNELSTRLSELDLQLSSSSPSSSSSSLLSSSRRLLGLHNQNASVLASQCPGYDFYLNSCEDQSGGGSNGDTFFLIICAALVLFMTIPGIISPFTSLHFTCFLSFFCFFSFLLCLFFIFLLHTLKLCITYQILYLPQVSCCTTRA